MHLGDHNSQAVNPFPSLVCQALRKVGVHICYLRVNDYYIYDTSPLIIQIISLNFFFYQYH